MSTGLNHWLVEIFRGNEESFDERKVVEAKPNTRLSKDLLVHFSPRGKYAYISREEGGKTKEWTAQLRWSHYQQKLTITVVEKTTFHRTGVVERAERLLGSFDLV